MEEVDCLMDEFEKYEGKPFNIQKQLKTSVSNVICSLLFGKRFDYEDAKFKRLMDLLNTLLAVLNFSSPAFIFPELSKVKFFHFNDANPTLKALSEFIGEMVEEHRQNFDENNINDYIDAYLLEQKQRTSEVNTTFTGKLPIKWYCYSGIEKAKICLFKGRKQFNFDGISTSFKVIYEYNLL